MNIGLFGDSYIDIQWHRYNNQNISRDQKIWAHQLLEELDSPVICSGLGGSNQYHAIAEWQRFSKYTNFDVAIFTFTWPQRLYAHPLTEDVVMAYIEGRELDQLDERKQAIQNALAQYYKYLYNRQEREFEFELMVKWCLELPNQYPNTKFIFLPNTVYGQEIAKKHFTRGVLVDFAFETLSLMEGERVGVPPFVPDRLGHLSAGLHTQIKDMVKHIILNERDVVYPVDYNQFTITKLSKNYYAD
jgi:hypothetical protein